jgi:predicted DNA-binding antitoxin AbrB/MazE fold protein
VVIAARYEKGVFKPLDEVTLEEGTVVEVFVSDKSVTKVRPSIRELDFVGMWKDRSDIKDGVSYVDDLRDSLRG